MELLLNYDRIIDVLQLMATAVYNSNTPIYCFGLVSHHTQKYCFSSAVIAYYPQISVNSIVVNLLLGKYDKEEKFV